MNRKIKRFLIGYVVSSLIFAYIYSLMAIGGYEQAREMCTVNLNIQRITTVTYFPVCWLLERKEVAE